MFWGLALKNALPSSGRSKKLLEIFLFFYSSYATACEACKGDRRRRGEGGGREEESGRQWRLQANKSEGQRRGRLLCALVFRGRIDW